MFDNLLEMSHLFDSNKWSNIGLGQEIREFASIKFNFTHLILSLAPNCINIFLDFSGDSNQSSLDITTVPLW